MLRFLRMSQVPLAEEDPSLSTLGRNLEMLYATLYSPPGPTPVFKVPQASASKKQRGNGGPEAARSAGRFLRLAGGSTAIAALVLLTAANYAAFRGTDLTDHLWRSFGNSAPEDGKHSLELGQTINGVTVTVDHVTYDGEPVQGREVPGGPTVEFVPVLVQFTASGLPEDTSTYAVSGTLSSGDGTPLGSVGGVGLRGQSDILDRELPPGTEQHLSAYDTTGAHREPAGMRLRLEVVVRHLIRDNDEGGTPGLQVAREDPDLQAERFIFDFVVPVK